MTALALLDRAPAGRGVDGDPAGTVGPRSTLRSASTARCPDGNLWHLTERLHVDLERTASSTCRP